MIPKMQECKLPLLKYLSDKKVHSLKECTEAMAKAFNLSNEERMLLTPCGKTTAIHHRTGWAKWNLEQEGLLKTVSRGRYIITDEGIQFLKRR